MTFWLQNSVKLVQFRHVTPPRNFLPKFFLGVIMKDLLAKEMKKFLEDSTSSYEFPVEYFTGQAYQTPGHIYGYGYKRNDKEELARPYVIENKNTEQV